MKKYVSLPFIAAYLFLTSPYAKADLWGGDIPLLTKIVFNTLHTMYELEKQSRLLQSELAGIHDRINRIQAISEVVQPSTWDKWKDPEEALTRLRFIYHTLPKEYRTAKSDAIEEEISRAMVTISKVNKTVTTGHMSGRELENRASVASPGVAQKLTASGIGTLITMQAQSTQIQSHIVSLLAQSLAEANEKEARSLETKGSTLASVTENMGKAETLFSKLALSVKVSP